MDAIKVDTNTFFWGMGILLCRMIDCLMVRGGIPIQKVVEPSSADIMESSVLCGVCVCVCPSLSAHMGASLNITATGMWRASECCNIPDMIRVFRFSGWDDFFSDWECE